MTTPQITQVEIPQGFIDFGIGQPGLSLLPMDVFQQATAHRFAQTDASMLQYGAAQGDGQLLHTLAGFLTEQYGIVVDPNQLFLTNGISQALDLICATLTQPGDTIFVEEPSYFLALEIFASHQLQVVAVPIDEDGLNIEALTEKLAQHQPIFVYTIPVFHNPSGYTMPPERREQLVQLSEQHNFLILADEVYQLLNYTAAPPSPFAHFDQAGTVLSLGSFSKILAPGLRLGWVHAVPDRLEPLVNYGYIKSGGGLNPFSAGIANDVIALGLQHKHLAHLKAIYQARIKVLCEALRQQIPRYIFTEPDGGFFIWGHLEENIDTESLLPQAASHQVGFQPGIKFSSAGGLRHWLRLSFAYYTEDELLEGVERLAEVIR